VGAGHFLNAFPGRTGAFVGLTGRRLDAADCLWARAATHFVTQRRLPELLEALRGTDLSEAPVALEQLLARLAEPAGAAGASRLAGMRAHIDACLEGVRTLRQLQERLAVRPPDDPAAQELREALRCLPPLSLGVTLRQFDELRGKSLEDVLRLELRLCVRMWSRQDLPEGSHPPFSRNEERGAVSLIEVRTRRASKAGRQG
jgi:enoyl-CoA hydratase